ncbi:CD276 antigen homolog isoform X2 [Carassius auratus]|uniref:CD276 antigen homolog isoform X2 n=1 Tax=Carassius auratus TaxID=7957 RepID=A0A6P6M756_CARAU|nr:CD276 antigen homolog isoform X2 [Carassius auratus]
MLIGTDHPINKSSKRFEVDSRGRKNTSSFKFCDMMFEDGTGLLQKGYIVLLHLVIVTKEVSLLDTVVGVIGGSVVLPCFSKEPQLTPEGITVNWKHRNTMKVYDIVKGKGSVEGQDPQYKNRVEGDSEQHLRGNFSFKLKNLLYSDAGQYQCYIIEESGIQTVELRIKEPLQLPFVPSVGGSVVLPCSSKQSQFKTEDDITVGWRHNETLKVYDIIKGKVSLGNQDSVYYNRTEMIRENYLNGNFSLKLNNVQRSDTGIYTCHITNELLIQSVRLEFSQGAQARPEKILLVPLLSVVILFCM